MKPQYTFEQIHHNPNIHLAKLNNETLTYLVETNGYWKSLYLNVTGTTPEQVADDVLLFMGYDNREDFVATKNKLIEQGV